MLTVAGYDEGYQMQTRDLEFSQSDKPSRICIVVSDCVCKATGQLDLPTE